MHGHIGGEEQGVPATYVYKLWMGHGITTIRDPGCGNGVEWCVSEEKRSERNEITAPRIFPYVVLRAGHADDQAGGWAPLGARHEGEGRGRHEVLRLSARTCSKRCSTS